MLLISLIGEQPIPNLLVARALGATRNLLFYTDLTERLAGNLKTLLEGADLQPMAAFDLTAALDTLQQKCPADAIVNLTGGTKTMALAAYEFARALGLPFVYMQSEGGQSRLYRYAFAKSVPILVSDEVLPPLITVDDYLRVHVGDYSLTGYAPNPPGGDFERTIGTALEPVVDEMLAGVSLMGALEVDFVVRCDNQIGVIEAKVGRNKIKMGLDQLNTVGGQEYLGTYTRKVLVSDQLWDHSLTNLKELAEARRITIIELPSFHSAGQLSKEDCRQLQSTICTLLGRELTP